MSFQTNVTNLAIAVATEVKKLHTAVNGNDGTGTSRLNTSASTLVDAINEVKQTADSAAGGGAVINDGIVSDSATWSSEKISQEIADVADDIPVLTDLIDDSTASSSTVYSSSKTDAQIAAAIADLFEQAPDTLDTIEEIAQAIQNNEDAITNLNRVRYDIAQSLNSTEQAQARSNIGAAAASDLSALESLVGEDTDFAAIFESYLEASE